MNTSATDRWTSAAPRERMWPVFLGRGQGVFIPVCDNGLLGAPCPSVRRHLVALRTGVEGLSERGTLVGFCALHATPCWVSRVPSVGVGGELIRGEERHVCPQAVSLEGLYRQGDLEPKKGRRKGCRGLMTTQLGTATNGSSPCPLLSHFSCHCCYHRISASMKLLYSGHLPRRPESTGKDTNAMLNGK